MSFRRPMANGRQSTKDVVKGTDYRTGLTTVVDGGEPCKTCGPHICPGFQLHFWRKVCQHCRCPESEHVGEDTLDTLEAATTKTLNGLFKTDNYDEMGSNPSHTQVPKLPKTTSVASMGSQKGIKMGNQHQPGSLTGIQTASFEEKRSAISATSCGSLQKIKSGATKSLVAKFMENIPEDEKKEGATYRQKQLLFQLPAHDIDGQACKTLMTEEEKQEMEDFRVHRQQHALGQGLIHTVGQIRDVLDEDQSDETTWKCEECSQDLVKGDTAIFTEKTGNDRCWHGKCFVCFKCKELLVDLIYFHKDNQVYCGRHHAELVKPRCKACDELIFTGEYTHAEDSDWHIVHFCCWRCDQLLGGKRYISRESRPYCLTCFDKEYGKKCNTCSKPITADESHLSHKDMAWHSNDKCFTCHTCHKSLVGKPFLPRLDHIFCSRACYKVCKDEKAGSTTAAS